LFFFSASFGLGGKAKIKPTDWRVHEIDGKGKITEQITSEEIIQPPEEPQFKQKFKGDLEVARDLFGEYLDLENPRE
jgi:hypothetical protein